MLMELLEWSHVATQPENSHDNGSQVLPRDLNKWREERTVPPRSDQSMGKFWTTNMNRPSLEDFPNLEDTKE